MATKVVGVKSTLKPLSHSIESLIPLRHVQNSCRSQPSVNVKALAFESAINVAAVKYTFVSAFCCTRFAQHGGEGLSGGAQQLMGDEGLYL